MKKPLLIARQGRRPSGLLGLIVAPIMAKETASENDTALRLLELESGDAVVEIGCGHGATLAKAAAIVRQGALCGIDFSRVMHRYAMRRHRRLVAAGRLEFRLGGSDQLPYPAAAFDKAYSVHTIYFWTTPLDHLREIRRVMRANGRFVLGFRPAEDSAFGLTFPEEVYSIRPEATVVALVREAGFEVIEVVARTLGAKRMAFIVAKPAAA